MGHVVSGAMGVAAAVAAAVRDASVGRGDDAAELVSKLRSLGVVVGPTPGASVTVVAGGAAGGAYAAVVSSVAVALVGACGWSWATTGEWVPRGLMWVTRTRFGEAVDAVKAQLRRTERTLGGRLDSVDGRLDSVDGRLEDGIKQLAAALGALEGEVRGAQTTLEEVRRAQLEDREQAAVTAEGVKLLCEVALDMPGTARSPGLLTRLSRVADATPVYSHAKGMLRPGAPGKKGPAKSPPSSPGLLDCVLGASLPPALSSHVDADALLGVEGGIFPVI